MDHIMRTVPSVTGCTRAVLVGGPVSIPQTSRDQVVGLHYQWSKLPHHGGYQHFERTGEVADGSADRQVVFNWTMRTEMAG